jgi:hypothetical protein
VRAPDRQLYLAYEIAAERLKRSPSRSGGVEILDHVRTDALKAPSTQEKAMALIGVSLLYAGLRDLTGFETVSGAVETMNAQDLPDPALGSIRWTFSGTRYQNGWTQKLADSSLENTFNQLGELEFRRALALANKIIDRRARAIAIIGIAQRCLGSASPQARLMSWRNTYCRIPPCK